MTTAEDRIRQEERRQGQASRTSQILTQPAVAAEISRRRNRRDSDEAPASSALTQGEILALMQDWLNGDRTNGISPNDAKSLLEDIGADPNLVDQAINNFNAVDVQESVEGTQVANPQDVNEPAGDLVSDVLGGGTPFLGEDEDFFTDPAFRGQALSLTAGGRDQLFNELVAQTSLGAGGAAPFVNTFAQRLRNPLEQLFRFGQQLPLASQQNQDPSTLPNFASFASGFQGIPGGGAFQDVIGDITSLQGNADPNSPFAAGIPDFFRQNPGQAFNLGFGASGISPFNPFADAFRNSSRTRFNAALGAGGDAFGFLQNRNSFFGG